MTEVKEMPAPRILENATCLPELFPKSSGKNGKLKISQRAGLSQEMTKYMVASSFTV